MGLIALFQVVVPLLLIGLIAFNRQPDRFYWTLTTLAFGMVLAFMLVSSRWDIVSIYARPAIAVLFLVSAVVGYRRIRAPVQPPGKVQTVIGIGVSVLLIFFMSVFCWFSFSGYAEPDGAIDLQSPFREGQFLVLHGGSNPFINGHAKVRPQNHALDIVGLNALGSRAGHWGDSPDLDSYVIFGAELYSPCDGTITLAVDGFDDLIPPTTDKKNLAGNHVLIECLGAEVVLAHLKSGSVRVKVGDQVTRETLLGRVGNTGNTSEPHLHIHAERGGDPGTILDGSAVPIRINGRYLVRGSVIKTQ